MPHLLKNGHPAHVFTTEDRRKAAAATNQFVASARRSSPWSLKTDSAKRDSLESKRAARARQPRHALAGLAFANRNLIRQELHDPPTSKCGSSAATGPASEWPGGLPDRRIPHHQAAWPSRLLSALMPRVRTDRQETN
jgi:hypothetical protein